MITCKKCGEPGRIQEDGQYLCDRHFAHEEGARHVKWWKLRDEILNNWGPDVGMPPKADVFEACYDTAEKLLVDLKNQHQIHKCPKCGGIINRYELIDVCPKCGYTEAWPHGRTERRKCMLCEDAAVHPTMNLCAKHLRMAEESLGQTVNYHFVGGVEFKFRTDPRVPNGTVLTEDEFQEVLNKAKPKDYKTLFEQMTAAEREYFMHGTWDVNFEEQETKVGGIPPKETPKPPPKRVPQLEPYFPTEEWWVVFNGLGGAIICSGSEYKDMIDNATEEDPVFGLEEAFDTKAEAIAALEFVRKSVMQGFLHWTRGTHWGLNR